MSMSDTNASRRARCNRQVEGLNLSESGSIHSFQRARYETYRKDKALMVIGPVNDGYKEALDFNTYRRWNT